MGGSRFVNAASLIVLATAAMPALVRANPIVIPPPVPSLPLSPNYPFLLALTLAVEMPIVAAFFRGRRLRLALACAAATTVTFLLMHLSFRVLQLDNLFALVVGEALVTLAEAAAYAVASGKQGRSLLASVVANAASFTFGLGAVL